MRRGNKKPKSKISHYNFLKENRRAISPVVATVLLVAMVIVIALIIFLWFRGLVGNYGEKFGKNVDLVCDDIILDASYSDGTLFITNDGNVPVFKINLMLSKEGSHKTRSLESLAQWPSSGLSQGGVFAESIDIEDSTSITLIPILIGTSDEGPKKSFTCPDTNGVEIIL